MLAAGRVFGMEPNGAVTAPAYDSGTPAVLTLWLGCGGVLCACSLSGWRVREIFHDHVIAAAILDGILYHHTTVNIKCEIYSLKERKKHGLRSM